VTDLKIAIASEAQQNQVLGHKSSKVFTGSYLSRHVRLDIQGCVDKGYGEQEHIDRLTGQAIERREDAPPRLPPGILREIHSDRELVRLRCVKDEVFELARNAALPEILLYVHLKYKTERLAFLDAVKTRIDDINKRKQATELFYNAVNALRTYTSHRQRLIHHRLAAFREDWFKQANASDALYRPTTVAPYRPTIDTTGARPALAWTSTSLDLCRLFHPEYELDSLSLELIETLAVDCDPREPRPKYLSKGNRTPRRESKASTPGTTIMKLQATAPPQAKKLITRTPQRKSKVSITGTTATSPQATALPQLGKPPHTDATIAMPSRTPSASGNRGVKRKRSTIMKGEQENAEQRSLIIGKKCKAKRAKVDEVRFASAREKECPAIEIGYLEPDPEGGRPRLVYY
jgi:Protein of unknown function (DUF3435)